MHAIQTYIAKDVHDSWLTKALTGTTADESGRKNIDLESFLKFEAQLRKVKATLDKLPVSTILINTKYQGPASFCDNLQQEISVC